MLTMTMVFLLYQNTSSCTDSICLAAQPLSRETAGNPSQVESAATAERIQGAEGNEQSLVAESANESPAVETEVQDEQRVHLSAEDDDFPSSDDDDEDPSEPTHAVDGAGAAPAVPAEYGTELTAEEASEALDADEVHREPDAKDGGDYTDYAGTEDDDEQSGEALPEDLSGSVSDLDASQHEILRNIYEAPSSDVGEKEAVEAEASNTIAAVASTTESKSIIPVLILRDLTVSSFQLLTRQ